MYEGFRILWLAIVSSPETGMRYERCGDDTAPHAGLKKDAESVVSFISRAKQAGS